MSPTDATPRILCVRFSALGDLVLITPLLRALRHKYPNARITVATKAQFAELFSHSPRVTDVALLHENEPLAEFAARLRASKYTHLLDLHGSLRSRALRLLVPGAWSGFHKRRLARELLIQLKTDVYGAVRPMAERYFDAAKSLGVDPDGAPPELWTGPAVRDATARWHYRQLAGEPFIALVPGAAHATKRWPARSWVSLSERLARRGSRVVIVGDDAVAAMGADLARRGGPAVASACGQFGLQGSAELLRRARAVVGGDTGGLHLATAVGTPVVMLLGPTVAQFGFLPYRSRAELLEMDLPCRPCSRHGGPTCPLGHHACLDRIGPEDVERSLARVVA